MTKVVHADLRVHSRRTERTHCRRRPLDRAPWFLRKGFAYIVPLSALVILTTVCSSIDDFEVEVAGRGEVPARTPLDVVLGELSLLGFDRVDVSQQFANQGVGDEDVDSVELVSLALTVEAPADATLDFVDSVAFLVEAPDLPRREIAEISSVPRGARTVSAAVFPGVELKPYVTARSMRIALDATGERPARAVTIRADVILDVDVTTGCE